MRGRTIPVRVTFSFTNQQTVTHVEWDNHFFTLIGSNGSFSNDPVGRVDEIMHGVNRVHGLVIFTQVFEYGFRHSLVVELRVSLSNNHIDKIFIHIFSFKHILPFPDVVTFV